MSRQTVNFKEENLFLSPTKISHIKFVASDFRDKAIISRVHLNFQWLGAGKCISQFVCGKMLGNPGGDYSVEVEDFSGSKELCSPGSLYTGSVMPNTNFTVSLWTLKKQDMDLSCYLWCTANGSLPESPPESSFQPDVTQELVTLMYHLFY